ncbi:MAG TPA: 3-dehydroquinate synthase [Ktedonobacterales bacterium]
MKAQYAQRVFLLGPTGSGKSTVGPRLAALLGWRFLDLDAEIERGCGRSISEIFAREGEAAYRESEAAALARVAKDTRVVIATGGGIGERPENLERMRKAGWRVTLWVTPETAFERRQAEALAAGVRLGEHRPMLAGDDPLARLRKLHERRRGSYEDVDDLLVAETDSPEQLATLIAAGMIGRGLLSPEGAQAQTHHVTAGDASYEAVVAWGALAMLGERLAALKLPPRLHVVADASVAALYEPSVMTSLKRAGFTPAVYRVPSGETSKSREEWSRILDWLAERRAERGEAVVALGGGVVGDLAGFAAATYLRGMPLVQIPTSLLAQVDASIGGKVGIDHPRGKNLIGAFHQPRLVVADPAALLTLGPRQRTEGWAEVVKHGVALDAEYFARIEREAEALLALRPAEVTAAVGGSVAIKAAVVAEDERESGRRALLNYGHTLGHAIEVVTGYTSWLHGEAVAVGMSFAARLGLRAGITPAEVVARQEALLVRLGLPTRAQGLSSRELLRAALWDKKARGGRLRWVLPTALGASAVFDDVGDQDVRDTLLEIGAVDDEPPQGDERDG